jgi:hypothetical protein
MPQAAFRSSIVVLALFFGACAHHRDVRPGAQGLHRVIVRAPEKTHAERSAISQAEHFCEEQSGRHPAFVEEKTQYTGSMDEATRDTVRKASRAAMILGGTGTVLGDGPVRTGGGVVGTAGTVGTIMTGGDDYVADMRFRCE